MTQQEALRQNVENKQKAEGMKVHIFINNVNLCMPCPSSDEVLATKGKVEIALKARWRSEFRELHNEIIEIYFAKTEESPLEI